MKGKTLAVTLATALMTTAALPTMAANDYEAGFIKTVDRTAVTQRQEGRSGDLHQVRDRGDGRRGSGGYHRRDGGHGNRGHGDRYSYRGDHGRHGGYGRHDYVKPSRRFYRRPYGHYRYYDNDDYLGAFLLGGMLGYILNQ